MRLETGVLDNRATCNYRQSKRFEISTSFPAQSFIFFFFLGECHRYWSNKTCFKIIIHFQPELLFTLDSNLNWSLGFRNYYIFSNALKTLMELIFSYLQYYKEEQWKASLEKLFFKYIRKFEIQVNERLWVTPRPLKNTYHVARSHKKPFVWHHLTIRELGFLVIAGLSKSRFSWCQNFLET